MTEAAPDWLLRFWFGDDRPVPYGILPPEKPVQPVERMTRQRRRAEARKAATGQI